MVTFLALLGVLGVLFAAAVLSTRDGAVLADAPRDAADVPLPDEPLTPDDVGRLKFSLAARGYRMSEVDLALERLARELADRDRRIGLLEAAAAGNQPPTSVREATAQDLPAPEPAAPVAPVAPERVVPPAPAAPVAPAPPLPTSPPAAPAAPPEPEPPAAPAESPAIEAPAAAPAPASSASAPQTPTANPFAPPPAAAGAAFVPPLPAPSVLPPTAATPQDATPAPDAAPDALPSTAAEPADDSPDPLPPADLGAELVTEERVEQASSGTPGDEHRPPSA